MKVYNYKNKRYLVEEEVQMKNPETRKWEPAYIYIQLETGLKFCREKEEFLRLFNFEYEV